MQVLSSRFGHVFCCVEKGKGRGCFVELDRAAISYILGKIIKGKNSFSAKDFWGLTFCLSGLGGSCYMHCFMAASLPSILWKEFRASLSLYLALCVCARVCV